MLTPLCAILLSGCTTTASSERTSQALAEAQEADRQYNLGHVSDGRLWIEKAIALANVTDVYFGTDSGESPGVIDILSNHGDYQELARVLKPGLEARSLDNKEGRYDSYGDALYRLGHKAESQAVYASLVVLLRKDYPSPGERTPTGRPAQLAFADAEVRAGDYADASRDYDAVRRLYPDFAAEAANNQAYLSGEDGIDLPADLKLAQLAVTKANDADDPDVVAEFQDTLGWVYYQTWLKTHSKNDLTQAIANLEQSSSALPGQGDGIYHLAAAYEANGQMDDARIEYTRLANIWPADDQAQAAVKRLGSPPVLPMPDSTSPETSV